MRHSPTSGSDATCAALRRGCVGGAVRRAWTAALHGPRCCTQRQGTGDRQDTGRGASGDAVQEGAPGGAVVVGTVHGDRHLLHGSGIALKGHPRRHQSGAVMRPPGFGLHHEQSHAASFRVGEWHRHVAAGAVAHREKGNAAHTHVGLKRRPALPRATQGVGCMPTTGRYGSVAGAEGPMPSAKSCWGIPASRGEMVSEGREGATFMPLRGWMARDARAVTEHWRRSNRCHRCNARVGSLPRRGTPG